MKSLWEIDADLQKATQELIENGGELTDELNEVLTVNNNEFEEKALNYIWLIKNLENEADLRASEIKRLQAKNKAIDTTLDTLKTKLLDSVKLRGKVKIGDFNLSVGKSKAVNIDNLEIVPFAYKSTRLKAKLDMTTYLDMLDNGYEETDFEMTPDKVTIKKVIEEGDYVPGVELIEKQHLVIK